VSSAKIKLLVTRYTPATGLKCDDVERALRLAPYALLSNDYEAIQKGVLDGKPVPPESHYGRSIQEVGGHLLGQKRDRKKHGLFGLF